jgi:HAD superfamily 5'-nucleotidase-like hydrolase
LTATTAGAGALALAAPQTKLKKWQRIFVNRSLNMGNVRAIGFDMDHTLVSYNREAFEALAFRETLKKFIAAGYPEELGELSFDPNFLIRGLLVDMDRGNLLKVDGHKYVKHAFHGKKRLPKDLRHKLYNAESFKAANLLSVDTFFALSEVQLFTEVVDYMDRSPGKIKKTYREVYQDLRHFIDQSHADGSIKNVVLSDPGRFLRRDKHLAQTLAQYVEAGKALFLLTNSAWDYTNALMSFVFDEPSEDFPDWRHYFEYIIVGAGKPGFFVGSQPFYEVQTDSGLLKLTGGPLKPNGVYHGGNAHLLQKLTGAVGDEILFVGDHIYGDIIRSKHHVNWRTLLIVEELDFELPKLEKLKEPLEQIRLKLQAREAVDEELQILRSRVTMHVKQAERARGRGEAKKSHYLLKENEKLLLKAQEKGAELAALDDEIKKMIAAREAAVHPVWGDLMKVGLERSRFADQVADYACIYTSSVTNLRFYSPFKRYSSTHDLLPHDL